MGTGRGSQSHRDSYANLIVRSLFDLLEIEYFLWLVPRLANRVRPRARQW